jgi:hypothetical protein
MRCRLKLHAEFVASAWRRRMLDAEYAAESDAVAQGAQAQLQR